MFNGEKIELKRNMYHPGREEEVKEMIKDFSSTMKCVEEMRKRSMTRKHINDYTMIDYSIEEGIEDKYMSDIISKEDVLAWEPGDIHFINAPMGKGKTTFVHKTLIETGSVLFLVHRRSLKQQVVMELKKENIDMDKVTVITYQELGNEFKNRDLRDLEQYTYIVGDEYHYFKTDASFNADTSLALMAILTAKNPRVVFMSATGLDTFDIIIRYFNLKDRNVYMHYIGDFFIEKPELYVFSEGTAVEFLKERAVEGKRSLYIGNNSDRMREQSQEIMNDTEQEVLFACSRDNPNYSHVNQELYKTLLQDRDVDVNMILGTSAISTGVSIEGDIDFVFSSVLNPEELIQSLGRVRTFKKDIKLKVGAIKPNGYELRHIETELLSYLIPAIELIRYGQDYYINKYYDFNSRPLVYWDVVKEEFNVNIFGVESVATQVLFIKEIREKGYAQAVADLLGVDSYVTYDTALKTELILKHYMEEENRLMFGIEEREPFLELVNFGVKKREQKKNLKFVNQVLKGLQLPLEVVQKRKRMNGERKQAWIIECTDEEVLEEMIEKVKNGDIVGLVRRSVIFRDKNDTEKREVREMVYKIREEEVIMKKIEDVLENCGEIVYRENSGSKLGSMIDMHTKGEMPVIYHAPLEAHGTIRIRMENGEVIEIGKQLGKLKEKEKEKPKRNIRKELEDMFG